MEKEHKYLLSTIREKREIERDVEAKLNEALAHFKEVFKPSLG